MKFNISRRASALVWDVMGHLVIVIIACALLYAAAGADMKSQVRWKTAESESAADRKLLQDTLEACKASTVTHDSP